MSILDKIGSVFSWPGRRISQEIAEEVAEKTRVAVRAGLIELDGLAPVITDLVAGRKVTLHSKTELWLEENETDTK